MADELREPSDPNRTTKALADKLMEVVKAATAEKPKTNMRVVVLVWDVDNPLGTEILGNGCIACASEMLAAAADIVGYTSKDKRTEEKVH